jgi:outer membrane receptor protein involved in Fe transport
MANMNPWIWAPATTQNSWIEERYAGFKGSAGDHFNYSVKVAHNKINNQPLFVNDTISGKSFEVLNEPEMKVMNFSGEVGYTVGEKFSVISNLTFSQYKTKLAEKAWGLLPLEFNTTMKVQVLKDLYVNANLFAFDGPWSLTKNGRKNLQGAMDLSAGLEFKIVDNIKLWAQFNNILNKEYQRWNQYPTYGFNFLGGVVFSFAQIK